MQRHRARIVACLAVLLALQTVLAPSRCLARMAVSAGHSIEICGPEGLRTITLPGDEAPQSATHGDDVCLACHALPQAVLPQPPILPTPAWVGLDRDTTNPTSTAFRPAIRGPPLGAQAPPRLS